ncbi:MAG: ECF transporter S component [Oscillospiraceae bacterium]|jgi:niacin transporter|nr:ECF transporter S component [Oscillospiraceae bacterium]
MSATATRRVFARQTVFSLTSAAVFLALGVLLPQVFHLALGQAGGQLFLPMHLSVLLAGCCLGWRFGALVGAITPLLSFFLTGMPPAPMLFMMMAELAIYGVTCGLLRRKAKLPLLVALPLALVAGRLAYAALLLLLVDWLHLLPGAGAFSVLTAVAAGWPGLLLQLALVPPLSKGLEKGRERLG